MKTKRSTLINKADKTIQELGRQVYQKCLVCGKPMSCLHHYFPKSSAGNLRYHWENLIPLCVGCHFSHHNGNPEIHNTINRIKGTKWLNALRKKKALYLKQDLNYLKGIIENLKKGVAN
jgi:hypothetical protein